MLDELKHFVQTLLHSLNPVWYTNIVELKPKKTIMHMILVLVFSMAVMCVLFLPSILNLESSLERDLAAFQAFKIDGVVNMTEPVLIPKSDPEVIFSINDEKRMIDDEKLLVTKEYVYFKPFGRPLRIDINKLFEPLKYKDEAAGFLSIFFIVLIPALLLFLFVVFALKYAFLIGLGAGLAFFVLKVLLLHKISFKRIFNVVAYAATLLIFLEIVFIPLNGNILVPLFQFLFLDFYLIPVIIFIGYIVASLWVVESKTPSEHKSSEWQF